MNSLKRHDEVAHLNRKGKVVRVFATTAFVKWSDGEMSRVPICALTLTKASTKQDNLKLTPAKRVERRFSDIVEHGLRTKGFSYEQLAEAAGIPESTLARFVREGDGETRERSSIATLERIAAALGIAPGDFWATS